jgi:outer membrane protein
VIALVALLLAADPAALPLDEALRQAVAHQPLLQSVQHRHEIAAAQLMQARAIEYPQISAAVELLGATANNTATSYITPTDFARVGTRPRAQAGLSSFTPFVDSLAGIGAHYDLLDFGYTRGTVGAAQANVEASTADQQQVLQDVLLRVTVAYFDALATEQALAIARDTLTRATEHDALAQAGVRSGLKPPIDLARSQAELQAAKLGVIRSQNSARVSIAALDTAIGWVPEHGYALVAPPIDTRPVPEEPTALQAALGTRFDLQALHAQEQGSELQQLTARSANYPRLLATSSVSLRGFDGLPQTLNYDLGLVLSVPLFTGFQTQGQEQEAAARLAELRSREVGLRDAISYQLRQARETIASAHEAIAASEAQVNAAKVGLSLAEGRYKQGLGNIVELTDAQSQFDAAQLGLVQSRLTAAVSRVQLDHAQGALRTP